MKDLKSYSRTYLRFLIMISIFLLKKGVLPYEYMDEQEKYNETLSPEKEKG